ncbi:MAG: hypothetical protein IJR92_02490 [Alphaproteobacteria bacterium]|nr:hypothetical protein [Alphaproteobacteria bacterium]
MKMWKTSLVAILCVGVLSIGANAASVLVSSANTENSGAVSRAGALRTTPTSVQSNQQAVQKKVTANNTIARSAYKPFISRLSEKTRNSGISNDANIVQLGANIDSLNARLDVLRDRLDLVREKIEIANEQNILSRNSVNIAKSESESAIATVNVPAETVAQITETQNTINERLTGAEQTVELVNNLENKIDEAVAEIENVREQIMYDIYAIEYDYMFFIDSLLDRLALAGQDREISNEVRNWAWDQYYQYESRISQLENNPSSGQFSQDVLDRFDQSVNNEIYDSKKHDVATNEQTFWKYYDMVRSLANSKGRYDIVSQLDSLANDVSASWQNVWYVQFPDIPNPFFGNFGYYQTFMERLSNMLAQML